MPVEHLFERPDTTSRNPMKVPGGTVVIVVMVVVVLLTYASYQFVDRMAVENIAATTQAQFAQLGTCIDSGEAFIKAVLALPEAQRQALGGTYNQQKLYCGRIVYDQGSPNGRGRFTLISPRLKENKVAGLRFGLVNESAKLSLSGLLEWERNQPGAGRHALMHLPGMEVGIADSLLDWIDSDSITREEGAESADYGSFELGSLATAPPNRVVPSLDGLLPVRGVTRQMLLGADRNANFFLSEREQAAAEFYREGLEGESKDVVDFLPWAYYLTPYSAERNQTLQGRARVNLNDSNLSRLHAELVKRFPDAWVNFILLYRQLGPSSNEGGVAIGSETQVDLELAAPFHFHSIYDLIGAKVQMPTNSANSESNGLLILSPFSDQPDQLKRYLMEFADQVTVSPRPTLVGRVNINRASQWVLHGVPGMNQELVKKIVEFRSDPDQGLGESSASRFYHESWLLAEGLVSLAQMQLLAGVVTTRGDLFRGQIIGFFDKTTLALREEVLLDATYNPPRTIYRRDLRHLGRGYSLDVLLAGRLSSMEEGADNEEGVDAINEY